VSLRARIALAAAVAVALAVVLVSLAAYATTRGALHDQVDGDLRTRAQNTLRAFDGPRGPGRGGPGRPPRVPREFGGPLPSRFGGTGAFAQLVDAGGVPVRLPPGQVALPTDPAARAAAAGGPARYSTVDVDGVSYRVLAVPVADGLALQVARPLDEVQRSLGRLRGRLVLVSAAGVLLAGLLGALVAARGVRPVTRLTESVELVARTRDLSHRIAVRGDDEPARLARTFNDMLGSLEQARDAQEQLVADASHELRTPLAALRTNAELLASGVPLPDGERRRIAADVAMQIDGFGRLVADLVELTRGARPAADPGPVRLDELVADAVARARAHHPGVEFRLDAEPATVHGDAVRLERAVDNLLQNAVRHGAPPVEVEVAAGEVRVRDHGPGIRPEDRARALARFWRAPEARGREGSGLGLAIAQQVARAHGGEVRIEEGPGGGALVVLVVPGAPGGAATI